MAGDAEPAASMSSEPTPGPTPSGPSPSLLGYATPWSVAPGERVTFMVSSAHPRYRVDIVRLIHGDDRPGAPGLDERRVPSTVDGEYPGSERSYPRGSFVVVDDRPLLRGREGFTLSGWFLPTTPGKGAQGLLTKWSGESGLGYGMFIDTTGALSLRIGNRSEGTLEVSTGVALRADQWYHLAVAFDPRGSVLLCQRPDPLWPRDVTAVVIERPIMSSGPYDDGAPLVMAAWWAGSASETAGHYNGRIAAPALHRTALDAELIAALADGERFVAGDQVCASWDFAAGTSTTTVHDVSANAVDGRAVNLPARGVTGHRFGGGDLAWTTAPDTHDAIHFHDDDLDDCCWEPSFELTIPDDMTGGVYAARLTSGDASYHVAFFVRPANRRAIEPILFLVPTNSYLAYANFREGFAEEHGVLGLYHDHGDGSPVFYSSALRPIVNMRPGADFDVLGDEGAPHQFNADLYLVDWLTKKGFGFDVATDDDLDREGLELLGQYRVVLTGSHPEYWTSGMLDSLGAYLADGGRLMYLGGNGLIWVTSFDPERRHVIEVRKWTGSPDFAPGDAHHSTTGEQGGYWRLRGRPPNRLVGVGSVGQGFDRSSPYRRTSVSYEERTAWIFAGIDDELIGDFGLTMGGAAGFEIDCADHRLGTPPHAAVVATATEFSPRYEHQNPVHIAGTSFDLHDPLRSDMVYFETPRGGAVFSVGSIAYCGSLSHDGYENNVSRVTENVLRRFADADWRS